jgi:hypothetical protein
LVGAQSIEVASFAKDLWSYGFLPMAWRNFALLRQISEVFSAAVSFTPESRATQ